MSRSGLSVVLLLAACGPVVGAEQDASTEAEPASTSSGGPSTSSSTSSSPPPPTGGDTTSADPDTSTTTGSSSSDESGMVFIKDPDGGGSCGIAPPPGTLHHCSSCSPWHQDCPRGEKCLPWANDGMGTWNATRCSPLHDDPSGVGELCSVEGNAVNGIDSCVVTAMCWNVDPIALDGRCVAFCEGSEASPICTPPGTDCMIANDGDLSLCLPTCDPLEPNACDDGQSCHPIGETWFCLPDGAPVHDGPLTPTLCEPGTTAVDPLLLPSACDAAAELCCTEICDVASPTCTEPLQCSAVGDGLAGVCVD